MNNTSVTDAKKPDMLSVVKEGMKVYDASGKHIGKVKGLHLGAAADTTEQPNVMPQTAQGVAPNPDGAPGVVPVASFVEPFDPDDELPEEVRERLRYNGFVRIDAGGLHRDRYALREQLGSVTSDEVRLNVAEDALIKS